MSVIETTKNGDNHPQIVETEVEQVTLLEDRARVVRKGTARLEGPSEMLTLRVGNLSPLIVDKTVTVRLLGTTSALAIADTRVVRRLEPEPESESDANSASENLVLELRQLQAEIAEWVVAAELLDAEADGFHRLASWTLGDLADDVARGRPFAVEEYEQIAERARREREIRAASVIAWAKIDKRRHDVDRLRARLQSERGPEKKRWCGVEFDLVGGDGLAQARPLQPGVEFEFELEYVVGAAMWRPAHTASLGDDGQVEFATQASVWQRSGENWENTQLLFSTERASLGTEPPMLTTDELKLRKRSDELIVETREQKMHVLSSRSVDVSSASELPGIADGGMVTELCASQKLSIPSDGRPHLVPLTRFSSSVAEELWSYPELSNAVICKTTVTNSGDSPILAGPVELIREGGWLGRTSVGFVAPGEEFELSWGAESTLRVTRESQTQEEERGVLSSWFSEKHRVKLWVSNFGSETKRIFVRERIPVSEIEKVKIKFESAKSSDGAQPDADGFLTWDLHLEGHSRKTLKLGYTSKRHSDVILS